MYVYIYREKDIHVFMYTSIRTHVMYRIPYVYIYTIMIDTFIYIIIYIYIVYLYETFLGFLDCAHGWELNILFHLEGQGARGAAAAGAGQVAAGAPMKWTG